MRSETSVSLAVRMPSKPHRMGLPVPATQGDTSMRPTARANQGAAERGMEVITAAASVLARNGYEGTSIDDIADELGATKGRVYHYYRSKSDILLGVLHAGLQQLFDVVEPIARDTAGSADDRLYRMARAHAMTMMTHHSHMVVMIRNVDRHLGDGSRWGDEAWDAVLSRRREYEQLFVDVLEDGLASGAYSSSDPRLTVRALLGALNWITVWFNPAADPTDKATPNRIADDLARFVIAGAQHGGTP